MNKLMLTALVAMAGCSAQGSPAEPIGTARQAETAQAQPGELRNLPKLRKVTPGSTGGGGGGAGGGSGGATDAWQPLQNQPQSFYAGTALLLTDGSVMVQDAGTSHWWKLVPDSTGSYVGGTWKRTAPIPAAWGLPAPLSFASAVLADGRVLILGGEYNGGTFNASGPTWAASTIRSLDAWTALPRRRAGRHRRLAGGAAAERGAAHGARRRSTPARRLFDAADLDLGVGQEQARATSTPAGLHAAARAAWC